MCGPLGLKSFCFGVSLPLGRLGWWPLTPRAPLTGSCVRARAVARPQHAQVLPPKRYLGAGEGVRHVEKWLGQPLPQVGQRLPM